jgi:hypothetical protein
MRVTAASGRALRMLALTVALLLLTMGVLPTVGLAEELLTAEEPEIPQTETMPAVDPMPAAASDPASAPAPTEAPVAEPSDAPAPVAPDLEEPPPEPSDGDEQVRSVEGVRAILSEAAASYPADSDSAPTDDGTAAAVVPAADEPAALAVVDNALDDPEVHRTATQLRHGGSVKVNELDFDGWNPRNQPHVGCEFTLRFFGFDPDVASPVQVSFVTQSPTANNQPLASGSVPLALPAGETLQGSTLVGSATFDLSGPLSAYTPHHVQGYHVKLSMEPADGNAKYKAFWVVCEYQPPVDMGTLTVTKAVEGIAPDGASYDFVVSDSTLPLYSFTLPTAGGEWTWTDEVPVGTYMVSETGGGAGYTTTISVDNGTATPGTAVEIDVDRDETRVVAFTNIYTPARGPLRVTKVVEGPAPQDALYAFDVTCGNDNPIRVEIPAGEFRELHGRPVGTCTVTEVDDEGADRTLVAVGDADPVAGSTVDVDIVTGTLAEVTFTNIYDEDVPSTGALLVTKDVEGPAAEDAEYAFTVTCPGRSPISFELSEEEGWTRRLTGLPLTTCTVTETGTGGAESTLVAVDDADATTGTTASAVVRRTTTTTVAFTNVFEQEPPTGALLVTKDVEGPAPEDAEYGFEVTCGQDTPIGFALSADEGWTRLLEELPVGTCSVTETETADADRTLVAVGDGAATASTTTSVDIADGTTAEVAFTNLYTIPDEGTGALLVTKAVEGTDAPEGPAFDFQVVCGEDDPLTFTLSAVHGWWTMVSGLEPGVCEVTELTTGDATTTVAVGGGAPMAGTQAAVTVIESATVAVDFVNDFGDTDVLPIVIDPTTPDVTPPIVPPVTPPVPPPAVQPAVVPPTSPPAVTVSPTTLPRTGGQLIAHGLLVALLAIGMGTGLVRATKR